MFRSEKCRIPMVLITLCLGGAAMSACSVSNQTVSKTRTEQIIEASVREKPAPVAAVPAAAAVPQQRPVAPAQGTAALPPQESAGRRGATVAAAAAPSPQAAGIPEHSEGIKPPAEGILPPPPAPLVSIDLPRRVETARQPPASSPLPPPPSPEERKAREEERPPVVLKPSPRPLAAEQPRDERQKARQEEKERDVMEEALVLLDEAQKYWVKGELEDALQMLDQAYALLLDTNGNPDIVRQKDDLRLLISKRILSIYNAHQSGGKVKRGEIPIATNAEVEKEIRLFQTVERNFFVSSYQRSLIYRPLILRELAKAGLPEELSWLPLVESGYKINALSPARALGLWQFIPSTGYKYGLNRDDWVDERMDIEKSTRAAIDYLKDLHAMFGDWLTVLAGYNCGEGRVMRTIASQHINYLDRFWDLYSRLPNETARYVPRFLATLLIVRDPQKYGIDLGNGDLKPEALAYELAEINRSVRLQDIAQKLDTPEETLFILNAELRHRTTPDRPYKLRVPPAKAEPLLRMISELALADRPRLHQQELRGVTITHKVRPGDTLASIAEKYRSSAEAIRKANHLSKKKLVAGQRLVVPIRSAKASAPAADREAKTARTLSHRVEKGETLSSLSKKYNVAVAEIRRVNGLKGDTLKQGQLIRLAAAESAEEKPPAEQKKRSPSPAKTEKGAPATEKAASATAKSAAEPAAAATEAKRYTVKKGDSLTRIARENKTTLGDLLKLNRMEANANIQPGQVLLLR